MHTNEIMKYVRARYVPSLNFLNRPLFLSFDFLSAVRLPYDDRSVANTDTRFALNTNWTNHVTGFPPSNISTRWPIKINAVTSDPLSVLLDPGPKNWTRAAFNLSLLVTAPETGKLERAVWKCILTITFRSRAAWVGNVDKGTASYTHLAKEASEEVFART